MTGNTLKVYLEKEHIAEIMPINDELHWHYTKNWQQQGFPLSPNLPLHETISSLNVHRFLRNLLPEGHALSELINYFHLSRDNTLGLVRALGADMPGALIILAHEQRLPQNSFFRPLPDSELEQRLHNHEFGLIIWDNKPRLSVAGVQNKINLVITPQGELGFGEGKLCSTHILKFENFDKKMGHLVLNEFSSMQLARHCGLKVANVALRRYGEHRSLLVERFDRKLIAMDEVKRRHMIDGCQALNLPPEYKYERNLGSNRDVAHIRDGASLPLLFDFANQCTNPALTKQEMIDWVLFNILISNYDAHGKNISFFVDTNGFSLTPFYDLVNVAIYPEYNHEMAMALGDEFDGNTINAFQLADFADSCNLSRTLVTTRLNTLLKKLLAALDNILDKTLYSEEEQDFLTQYKNLVYQRCHHLQQQAGIIGSMEL